jgi:hypothetical protein
LSSAAQELVHPVNRDIGTRKLSDPVEGQPPENAAVHPALQPDIFQEHRQVPGALLD